jgi:hypothetical protein
MILACRQPFNHGVAGSSPAALTNEIRHFLNFRSDLLPKIMPFGSTLGSNVVEAPSLTVTAVACCARLAASCRTLISHKPAGCFLQSARPVCIGAGAGA